MTFRRRSFSPADNEIAETFYRLQTRENAGKWPTVSVEKWTRTRGGTERHVETREYQPVPR